MKVAVLYGSDRHGTTRPVFAVLAFTQRHNLNPMKLEREYWLEQGWTQGTRPWTGNVKHKT